MIRTTLNKSLLVVAALAASGTMMVNCSKGSNKDNIGEAKLALTLPGGGIINTVTYKITGNGIAEINGSIDVTNKTTATALVTGLPAGNGYLVKMDATSVTMPTQTCGGQVNFNVEALKTAVATVVLLCRAPAGTTGAVAINGGFNQCPYITGISASTLEASVGGSVAINVTATDLDGDAITYAWTQTGTSGAVAAPASASTTFNCTGTGLSTLSISVSDGKCGDALMAAIPINCVAAPGAGTAGTSAAAGTNGAAGTTATAGTNGAAGTTAAGGTTGAAGTTVACTEQGSASCQSCTAGNCSVGPTGTDGCCGLADPADVALCQALSACIGTNASTCVSSGDPTGCFCGTVGGDCFSTGVADGVCAPQFRAAAKTTVPATILERFVSPVFPIGRAVNMTACRGNFCGSECGL